GAPVRPPAPPEWVGPVVEGEGEADDDGAADEGGADEGGAEEGGANVRRAWDAPGIGSGEGVGRDRPAPFMNRSMVGETVEGSDSTRCEPSMGLIATVSSVKVA